MQRLLFFLFSLQLVEPAQMLTVAGKLECCTSEKTPCPIYRQPTEVQIWEKRKFLSDKHLQSVKADSKTGNFVLSVPSDSTFFAFKPYLKIVHDCNAKPGCKRVFLFDIPEVFIRRGWTFSISHLNLRKPFLGDNHDQC